MKFLIFPLPFSPSLLILPFRVQTPAVQVNVNEFVVDYAAEKGIGRFRQFSHKLNRFLVGFGFCLVLFVFFLIFFVNQHIQYCYSSTAFLE